ncbi:hypothetical protein DL93DRAFT_2070476 [Clavulina sp. PMI_390]|nr:hypothetical protein DL93DRAFT_2070476 [Clavulina sp. PMI_390]
MDNNTVRRAIVYVLARCASQPQRFRPPQQFTQAQLTQFRLLAAVAFTVLPRPRSGVAPAPSSAPQAPPAARPPFPHAATWNQLDLQMNQYEEQSLQDIALSNIPIADIYDTADRLQASNTPLPCYEDALAEALVKWFKPNFFKWADPIKCTKCGKGTNLKEVTGPSTQEEREGGAGRVEIHICEDTECGTVNKFPRFNNLATLMKPENRRGRCGEFAGLFTLFIRAIGLRARYVWNAEDHVWNEYWSPAQNRWVHMDSCENARDEHHIYSKGWGKKMSYCVAFSVDGGAMDVSHAYIPAEKWGENGEATSMRARAGNEADGEAALQRIRDRRREGLPAAELSRLAAEDERDRTWWKEVPSAAAAPADATASETPSTTATDEAFQPRQSGTQEWKESRGEAGKPS